jgi:hypothetical protein
MSLWSVRLGELTLGISVMPSQSQRRRASIASRLQSPHLGIFGGLAYRWTYAPWFGLGRAWGAITGAAAFPK